MRRERAQPLANPSGDVGSHHDSLTSRHIVYLLPTRYLEVSPRVSPSNSGVERIKYSKAFSAPGVLPDTKKVSAKCLLSFIIIKMDDHAHHRCCILSQKSPKPMHCLAPSSQRNYPFHGNSWLGTDTMMLPLGLSGQGLGVPMFFPTGYKSIS